MIYAAAGFAFYSLTMAVVNLIRYRRLKESVCTAQSLYAFSSALVSVYFLQASILAAFSADSPQHSAANALTGSCVLLCIVLMAVHMIRSSAKKRT